MSQRPVERLSPRDKKVLLMLCDGQTESEIARKLVMSRRSIQNSLGRISALAVGGSETLSARFELAQRQMTEHRLKSLAARFQALLEAAQDAVVVANGTSGVISQANERASALFKIPMSELVGMNVDELVPIEQRSKHVGLRVGFLASIRKREMGYHPPIFALRGDGSKIEMAISLTATASDDEVMVVCSEYARWSLSNLEGTRSGVIVDTVPQND